MRSRQVILPLALFLFALAVRVAYLRDLPQNPLFDNFPQTLDHYNFDQSAISLSQGDLLARAPNNNFAPLYKYFLGLIYWLFGRNFYAVYLIQFMMGAFSCVLVYWIARDLFGTRAGVLASLGLSLYATQIVYEGIILRASFISFWGLLSFYLLSRLPHAYSASRLTGAALALSMFFQSRPNTLICLPLACVYLRQYVFALLDSSRKTRGWIVFGGVLTLSFVPLLTQCYLVHDRFVFFDAGGAHALISGNLTAYSGTGLESEAVENYRKENDFSYPSVISYLFRQTHEAPFEYFQLYLRKLFYYLNGFEPPSNLSVYLFQEYSNILSLTWKEFALYSSLGLIGMVLAVKHGKNVFLLHSYIVSLSLGVLLFHIVARYRLPAVPYFIIFSAYAVDCMMTWARRRQFKNMAAAAAAFVVLFAVFQEPGGAERIRANDYGTLGNAFLMRGDREQALTAFQKSRDTDPNNVYARINLGRVYAETGLFAEAAAELNYALKLDPERWQTPFNLGKIHFLSGNYKEAETFLLKARGLHPRFWQTSFYLGKLYAKLDRHEEAIDFLNDSLRGNPGQPETYFILGAEHGLMGRYPEAVRALKKAVGLKPDFAEGYNNLGAVYARMNLHEQAAASFAEALKLKPDFPEARANLNAVRGLAGK